MIPTILKKYPEQVIWSAALIWLFFMNPSSASNSLCIFKFAGFNSCMGCGIGHAIYHAMHLNFRESFGDHIMGIPATLWILWQIVKPFFINKTHIYHGSTTANDVKRITA